MASPPGCNHGGVQGVPVLLSLELLFTLARMGHGDEIVLAHVNFPSSSMCRGGPEEIRANGLGIPQLLVAVLQLRPLDTYVDWKKGLLTPVWMSYQFAFYERSKKAFAVLATGSSYGMKTMPLSLGNVILLKEKGGMRVIS
ncbi:hypothetical protein FD754_008682 [Muntiacus muntjak]|uniref:L-fucose mutarotase n=1 Tax=Muntiacus muntjak TaxID=9888 RepID=A0A5N3WWD6_MUNMU|nr:hypothetical protein FD754_008682 [Muntiacus muntjak]